MSDNYLESKAQVAKNLYISALVFAGIGVLQKLLVVMGVIDPIGMVTQAMAGQISSLTGGRLGVAKLLSNVSNLLIPLAVVLLAVACAVQNELQAQVRENAALEAVKAAKAAADARRAMGK